MSNVIKAYAVRYDEKTRKYIDTRLKDLAIENTTKKENITDRPDIQEGFVEGLKVATVELQTEDNRAAAKLTEEASREAEMIIEQAKAEAARIKNEAFAEAQKRGYEEGMQKARKEAARLEAEYAHKLQMLQQERENMVDELQPQIAEIIAGLVEKITGVVTEGKEDLILYLVERAIKRLDRCNELTIKVSSEDYEYLTAHINQLKQALDREISIYIEEEASLQKNKCLIETEYRVIDCSLDIQLNNLLTDIKLIGGI